MPTNKNMFERFRVIDEMLCQTGGASTEEISNRLRSVDLRTIQKDIRSLKEDHKLDIVRFGNRYCYADCSKSLFRRELTANEKQFLAAAVKTIGQIDGLPQFSWLENIKKSLDLDEAERPAIEFGRMFEGEGMNEKLTDLMPRLFIAIIQKRSVTLSYQAFTDTKPKAITVSPYLLKEYKDRWFLVCSELTPSGKLHYLTKAIDRIKDFTYSDNGYNEADINFQEDIFEYIIGVTDYEGGKPVDVVFCVNPKHHIDQYVRTKPFHSCQAEVAGTELEHLKESYPQFADWAFFKLIGIKPNIELYQTMVSYFGDLVVISPASVRRKIQDKAAKLLSYYESIGK